MKRAQYIRVTQQAQPAQEWMFASFVVSIREAKQNRDSFSVFESFLLIFSPVLLILVGSAVVFLRHWLLCDKKQSREEAPNVNNNIKQKQDPGGKTTIQWDQLPSHSS